MIRQLVITTLISLCMVSMATAQTFTQRLQQKVQGEGTITVHHDKAIDLLVNGTNTTTASNNTAATVAKPNQEKHSAATVSSNTATAATAAPTTSPDTVSAQKNVRTMRVTGYRVQVYAGGNSRADRLRAERTGNELRTVFPNEQVYTHFHSPRWICRIGNYRTYEEARKMLDEVKKMGYASATIVKGKISVPY